jgi:hypothetical protein
MPSTNVDRIVVVPRARTVCRIRTRKRYPTRMMTTVNDTCVLGKQLSTPLMGRMISMRPDDQRSESNIAPESGNAQRSGTGKNRKKPRLSR